MLGTSPSEPPVTTEPEQPEQISRENTTDHSSDQTGEVPASRHELVEATMSDPTLRAQRELADKEANGFKWCEGLLFKYQLDVLGNSTKKLCLPKPFMEKCLILTHDKFGHRGTNKVAQDVAKNFFWPSLWSDTRVHCRVCRVCQQHNKSKPRHSPMVEREVVVIPSERVCVDLVGPLPKAKGGFEYMLTCMDVATHWLEAVPLRKTTTAIIVKHLLEMFSRNGFPGIIVSDNGPQFLSKAFESFCTKHSIEHVKTSVYCPESNGVLERFHGTLKQMVQKCMTSKGCCPDVLPLCLFFLRLTPNAASGFSPFMLSHGWEPTTPSKVLYNAWVGKQLGDMSVEDWVADNCESIQQLRDEASVNYIRVSEARKDKVDKKAQVRVFTVGQEVWYRTPGLSEALQPSWHGPYRVVKVAGPVSYVIDVEGKHRPNCQRCHPVFIAWSISCPSP